MSRMSTSSVAASMDLLNRLGKMLWQRLSSKPRIRKSRHRTRSTKSLQSSSKICKPNQILCHWKAAAHRPHQSHPNLNNMRTKQQQRSSRLATTLSHSLLNLSQCLHTYSKHSYPLLARGCQDQPLKSSLCPQKTGHFQSAKGAPKRRLSRVSINLYSR